MNRLLLLLFAVLFSTSAFAQKGKIIESLEFKSKEGVAMKYSVYLPADYETSQRSYPVVYLLHGYSDDETGWVQFGEANAIADKGIADANFPPCIIIMPDGKVTWYCNSYDGKERWEDNFVNEFIPYVEKQYRIRPKKEFRAIAGLSMGGFGALKLSMRHPDLFAACVALSSGTFSDEEILAMPNEQYERYFGGIFGNQLKSNERINEAWKANSPLHLIQTVSKSDLKSVKYWIDCGDDDFLYKGTHYCTLACAIWIFRTSFVPGMARTSGVTGGVVC
jgi:Predicted esterase